MITAEQRVQTFCSDPSAAEPAYRTRSLFSSALYSILDPSLLMPSRYSCAGVANKRGIGVTTEVDSSNVRIAAAQ